MPSLPLPFVLSTGNPDKAREINEIFVALIDEPLAAWALTVGPDTFGFVLDRPVQVRPSKHLPSRPRRNCCQQFISRQGQTRRNTAV